MGWLRWIGWVVLLAGCSGAGVVVLNGSTMGSTWTVTVVMPDGRSLPVLRADIIRQLERVVVPMNTWEPGSDISRFNQAAAGTAFDMTPEFCGVLAYALTLAADSGGAFDPTVAPLVEAWGFGPEAGDHQAPTAERLAAARARVSYRQLGPGCQGGRLVQPGGVRLDFSALAPGYAADVVSEWLQAQGLPDHLVDIGGEFRARGRKPDDKPWVVGIEDPSADDGRTWETLILQDRALATSGDYRRFYVDAGQRRSHSIDPRTGAPVEHGLALVSVVMPTAMQADAVATVLSVLGAQEGMAWASERKIAALFLVRAADGTLSEQQTAEFSALRDAPP